MKPQKALTLLMFFIALCFFLAFLVGTQENTAYLLSGPARAGSTCSG